MMKNKTFFLSLATIAYTFLSAFPAAAIDENDAILVKIQDIKPIKDDNGLTTGCEFLSTIYNRTDSDLTELSFDLSWVDEAVKNTINFEQNMNRNGRNDLYGTADYVSPDVISTLNIPVLKKNSQKSMRGTISTDRCFILLEDAKINVSSCKQNNREERKGGLSCQSLFKYISSKSPEYYTDFLAVSIENQKEMDSKEKARQSQELDTLFKNVEANMNRTARLLNNTVAPGNPLPAAISNTAVTTGGSDGSTADAPAPAAKPAVSTPNAPQPDDVKATPAPAPATTSSAPAENSAAPKPESADEIEVKISAPTKVYLPGSDDK